MTGQTRPRLAVGSGVIDLDRELPWLQEQVKAYAGMYRVRATIFQDNFTGETVEMRTAYRHALAEPAIKAALLGKIGSVMALGLQVKPAANATLDHEVVDFIRHALTKCQGGLPELVWTILAGGLIDGFSVSEKVWRREIRGRFKGKISLQKLKGKDSRYIQFEIDPYRNITGVLSMRGNAGEMFPPTDFVIFKYLSLFENPFGMSDLRAAYRAAEMIPQALLLRMIFLDKYSGPFLHGKILDPALMEDMKSNLAKARSGGFIVTSPNDEIEIHDLAGRGTSEFLAAIEDLRKEIAISVSGAFLHMMTGGGNDQRGDSRVQQDTVDLFIWLLKTLVEACINEQLVPDLVAVNYGDRVEYPTVSLEAPNPELVVAELAIDESLASLNVPLSLSELYERTGRRPPKDELDKVQAPAPAVGNDFFANAKPKPGNPANPAKEMGDDQLAMFAEWEESKHPRGQLENAGEFGPGGRGKKKASDGDGKKSGVTESPVGKMAQQANEIVGKIKPSKSRAFTGEPTGGKISKQLAGAIGEEIIIQHLRSLGYNDAGQLSGFVGTEKNNLPVDLIHDHRVVEVKTGQASNSSAAQQWRLTIGEPGEKEKAWLAKASPEAKAKFNAKKQSAIHARKKKEIAKLGKELGYTVSGSTMTVVLNPDTKTADIYHFEGFHDRIGWTSEQASAGYVRSVQYG